MLRCTVDEAAVVEGKDAHRDQAEAPVVDEGAQGHVDTFDLALVVAHEALQLVPSLTFIHQRPRPQW